MGLPEGRPSPLLARGRRAITQIAQHCKSHLRSREIGVSGDDNFCIFLQSHRVGVVASCADRCSNNSIYTETLIRRSIGIIAHHGDIAEALCDNRLPSQNNLSIGCKVIALQ